MVDEIRFAHLNAHSLTSEETYSNIFSFISGRKYSIIVVSETHKNRAFKSRVTKIYPNVEVKYNHAVYSKAGILIMYPLGFQKFEEMFTIDPHTPPT